ncbi:MAG: alpha/beta hydrolase [Sphingobium sp.]|nr:MAG: alpha/beta hydrolase [Sphingobium sp.]
MPYFCNGDAEIFFEDVGAGPLVIAAHGMMSPGYWPISGVSGVLGLSYRVVSFDLRGHGRTHADHGFDVETMASDIGALADHLGAEKFHLVGHATGGIVVLRYAMRNSARLNSLIVMDCASQTAPMPPEHFAAQAALIAATDRREMFASMKQSGAGFFFRTLTAPQVPSSADEMIARMFAGNDPATLGKFMMSFFADPDPKNELLQAITCPTLCAVGELDEAFVEPVRQIAEAIPGARYQVLEGVGHMTAFENPFSTIDAIDAFLRGGEIE